MHSYELRTCLFFFTCNLLKSWCYLNRSELYNCDWFELATFDSYYWSFGRNTDCRISEYDNDFSALEICNLNYDKLSHDFSVEAYNCSRLRSNDVMAFSRSLEHYAAQKQEMSDSQGKNCLSGWKMQCYFSFENLLMSLYHQYPFLQWSKFWASQQELTMTARMDHLTNLWSLEQYCRLYLLVEANLIAIPYQT